jgi:hypothetical protein
LGGIATDDAGSQFARNIEVALMQRLREINLA